MQYGWHGRRALLAAVNERTRDDVWRSYMAAVAYSIGKLTAGMGGNEYPLPSYYELLHKHDQPVDIRSGQEIVDDLIARLGKEGTNAVI